MKITKALIAILLAGVALLGTGCIIPVHHGGGHHGYHRGHYGHGHHHGYSGHHGHYSGHHGQHGGGGLHAHGR